MQPIFVIRMVINDILHLVANERARKILMVEMFTGRPIICGLERHQFLPHMRKGRMPHIMEKSGQTHELPRPAQMFLVEPHLAYQVFLVLFLDGVEQPLSDVHDAQRMLEPGVDRTGIDVLREGELSNTPQTLKHRVVDDVHFPGG